MVEGVALAAGLTIGLSSLLWSQALIAEVYAPAAFFTALLVVLVLRRSSAWLLGLVWGVGMGVHLTLAFLAPLVAWEIWSDRGKRLRRSVEAGLATFLVLGVMYGPVLLARDGVPSPWADVGTLSGWWALVSGRLYRGYLFGLPLIAYPQRLLAWAGLLARQLTPFGAVLAALGWVHLRRACRSLALVSVLAFGVFSLYAVAYDTADSLVYLVPALPLTALWLGVGFWRAAGWLDRRLRRGAWAILILPMFQVLFSWGSMDVSEDWTAMGWAEQVMEEAPSHAILLAAQDAHTFTLWYAHDVLGWRQDVVAVDQDMWWHEPYRRAMIGELGIEIASSALSVEEAAHRAGRPVVYVSDQLGQEKP
jgi:hypothetical protein